MKKRNKNLKIRRRKCLIWTRVSTKEQYENGSLNTQLIRCKKYATELGFEIIKHKSAFESAKQENEKFLKMIKYLTDPRNKFDALIVLYANRFSRKVSVATTRMEELRAKGIYLHIASVKLSSEKERDLTSLTEEFTKAERDNRDKSDSTILNRLVKLQQGIFVGKPPMGYVTSNNKGKLDKNKELLPSIIPCPEKSPLIRNAYKLVLQHKSLTEITSEVNKQGLDITRKYLGEILRKPIYCGKIVDKTLQDEEIDFVMGKHEKIITVHEYDRVQKLLDKKALKGKTSTDKTKIHLNGTLKCYKCGNNLAGYVSTKTGAPFYKCNHGCTLNLAGENIHEINYSLLRSLQLKENVEGHVKESIEQQFKDRYNDSILKQKHANEKITKLQKRLKNLRLEKLDGEIDLDEYREIKEDTENQIATLETEASEIKIPDIEELTEKVIHLLNSPEHVFKKLGVPDKIAFLKVVLKNGLTYHKEKQEFENTVIGDLYQTKNAQPVLTCTAA